MSGFELKAICDQCKEAFIPNVVTEPCEAGGEKVFFTCPECDRVYIVAIASKVAVQARKSISALRDRFKTLMKLADTREVVTRRLAIQDEIVSLQLTIDANVMVNTKP